MPKLRGQDAFDDYIQKRLERDGKGDTFYERKRSVDLEKSMTPFRYKWTGVHKKLDEIPTRIQEAFPPGSILRKLREFCQRDSEQF